MRPSIKALTVTIIILWGFQVHGSQINLSLDNRGASTLPNDYQLRNFEGSRASLLFNSRIEKQQGGIFNETNFPRGVNEEIFQWAYGDLENFVISTAGWGNTARRNVDGQGVNLQASIQDNFVFDFEDGVTGGQVTVNLRHNATVDGTATPSVLSFDWGISAFLRVESQYDNFSLNSTGEVSVPITTDRFTDSAIAGSVTIDITEAMNFLDITMSVGQQTRFALQEDSSDFFFMDNRSGTTIEFELSEGISLLGSQSGFYSPTTDTIVLPDEVTDDGTFVFPTLPLSPIPFPIDPDIAVGYEFEVDTIPFATIQIDENYGDGIFDVYIWDETLGEYSFYQQLFTEVPLNFNFTDEIKKFKILGIEEEVALDPTDTEAFVALVSFNGVGNGNITMKPITKFIPDDLPIGVDESNTLYLFLFALLGIFLSNRGVLRWSFLKIE